VGIILEDVEARVEPQMNEAFSIGGWAAEEEMGNIVVVITASAAHVRDQWVYSGEVRAGER